MDISSLLTWLLSLLLGLTNATATLASVRQVDDHPLYVLTYHGDYSQNAAALATLSAPFVQARSTAQRQTYACSLFVWFGDPENPLYGRNFDWRFSPAALVFTDPPEGYASVSVVDIGFLGYTDAEARRLLDLPLAARGAAHRCPTAASGRHERIPVWPWPLPPCRAAPGPTIPACPPPDRWKSVRLMLDHARTVDEALTILRGYNIDFTGGPSIHYLIADASGQSALAEIYEGEWVVIPGGPQWAIATNFYMASVPAGRTPNDRRYNVLMRALEADQAPLETAEALAMLGEVAQTSTQWSVVYGLKSGEVHITLDRDYTAVYSFALPMAAE